MQTERPDPDRPPEDTQVPEGCPTCGGAFSARITRSVVWAWCGPCHRLTRPVLVDGPRGRILVHRSAAA